MSDDEIGGIIIFGFLPIFLFMFTLIFAHVTPKNMIIFDKEKKEFCLRCGKSLAEIKKPVYISVHDIISVNYEKYRFSYFVILITFRPSYIDIKLKNGKRYTVYDIAKPEDAKYNLQRILVNYNKPEEE